jgi:diguanylate cyclase (GGDEF)-like protein
VSVSGLRFKSSRWLRASLQPATLLGLMMIAACWLSVVVELEMERGNAMDAGIQQSANLARLFEANTVRIFEGVDRTLLLLREAYERDPAHFDLHDWSRRTALVGDFTLILRLIGPDGYTIDRTDFPGGPPLESMYVGDRDHFRAQVDANTDELFIDKPAIGQVTGRLTIQISRRLHHPDGSFAGTLAASLDPGFVEKFFETVDLGPQGSVVLRSRDGVILAARGLERPSLGRTVLQPSLVEALARGPAGHYWGGGAVDGVNRLVSYRAADKYPLLVMLGISESTVFEAYRRSRLAYVTIASIITVLILVAIAAGIRHQSRLDRIRDDLERKTAELETTLQEVRRLAHHDALTNLPNRTALAIRLAETFERSKAEGTSFAVLTIDLDQFKEANDVFGHVFGDELLCAVSKRLEAAAHSAFIARVGGDEFTLISATGAQPAIAMALADRLLSVGMDQFEIRGQRISIGLSAGVAIYPINGHDTMSLLANADAALYRAKADGRHMVRFFDPEMDEHLRERYLLQHDLRSAITQMELALEYQPQAKIEGEVFGFEALVRWHHPQKGLMPPATFITLAEQNGLINEIGEWTLREACREAASWSSPLQIGVNLSPIQFRHGDLPGLVHQILLDTGLAPARLELEITEGVLIGDPSRALSILRRLKILGVKIAMDDFGTGYASLSSLQSFPFDKIKIDRSFVSGVDHNPHSAEIVRAVISLGKALRIPVIAEGVETEAERTTLLRNGCEEIQGYLVGRPRPIASYVALINGVHTKAMVG